MYPGGHPASPPPPPSRPLAPGDRVRRDHGWWRYGDDDGGGGGEGTVASVDGAAGLCTVRWDANGRLGQYRWGHGDAYDVRLAAGMRSTGSARTATDPVLSPYRASAARGADAGPTAGALRVVPAGGPRRTPPSSDGSQHGQEPLFWASDGTGMTDGTVARATGAPGGDSAGCAKLLLIAVAHRDDPSLFLPGATRELQAMQQFLNRRGFMPPERRVLCEDGPMPPTRSNIMASLRWLVRGAVAGDALFVHFVGRGVRSLPELGDDPALGDGEALAPSDWRDCGVVRDDEVWDILVGGLAGGARVTCVFDLFRGQGMLDLPFRLTASADGGLQLTERPAEPIPGQVLSVSLCGREAAAADGGAGGVGCGPAGALSTAFIAALVSRPRPTHEQLAADLRAVLRQRLGERAPGVTLSASRRFGLRDSFTLAAVPQDVAHGGPPDAERAMLLRRVEQLEEQLEQRRGQPPPRRGSNGPARRRAEAMDAPDEVPGAARAVIVGIDYADGDGARLDDGASGAAPSKAAKAAQQLLMEQGFHARVQVLSDDAQADHLKPTRDNILAALRWLARDATAGDALYFHFIGHGAAAAHGGDGSIVALAPADFARRGYITGDEVHSVLIRGLPAGCRLTCVCDLAAGGTLAELPHVMTADAAGLSYAHSPLDAGDVPASVVVLCSQPGEADAGGPRPVGCLTEALGVVLGLDPQPALGQLLGDLAAQLRQQLGDDCRTPRAATTWRCSERDPFHLGTRPQRLKKKPTSAGPPSAALSPGRPPPPGAASTAGTTSAGSSSAAGKEGGESAAVAPTQSEADYPAPPPRACPVVIGASKALTVGCDYAGQACELSGCVRDTQTWQRFLQRQGFHAALRVLTDDNPATLPTRSNVMSCLRWLVRDCVPGDSLLFHWCGHGGAGQGVQGGGGGVPVLYPCDWEEAGTIGGPELVDTLTRGVPSGVRITAVLDVDSPAATPLADLAHSLTACADGGCELRERPDAAVPAHVVVVTAAPPPPPQPAAAGQRAGALTTALMTVLNQRPQPQHDEMLRAMLLSQRARLGDGCPLPRVTSTRRLSLSAPFHFGAIADPGVASGAVAPSRQPPPLAELSNGPPAADSAGGGGAAQVAGATKALLVGVDYAGRGDSRELPDAPKDALAAAGMLQRAGFRRESIKLLTDEDPRAPPTRANILQGLRWLTSAAEPGDSLFFSFSGHGAWVRDAQYAEDGVAAVAPLDWEQAGMIGAEELLAALARPLIPGVRLTALIDVAYPGQTGPELQYSLTSEADGGLALCGRPLAQDESPAHVVVLSALRDPRHPAPAPDRRGASGALTAAVAEALGRHGQPTCAQLLAGVRQKLCQLGGTNGLVPRLTSTRPFAPADRFSLQTLPQQAAPRQPHPAQQQQAAPAPPPPPMGASSPQQGGDRGQQDPGAWRGPSALRHDGTLIDPSPQRAHAQRAPLDPGETYAHPGGSGGGAGCGSYGAPAPPPPPLAPPPPLSPAAEQAMAASGGGPGYDTRKMAELTDAMREIQQSINDALHEARNRDELRLGEPRRATSPLYQSPPYQPPQPQQGGYPGVLRHTDMPRHTDPPLPMYSPGGSPAVQATLSPPGRHPGGQRGAGSPSMSAPPSAGPLRQRCITLRDAAEPLGMRLVPSAGVVVVDTVSPDGPAARAGIHAGDMVRAIAGYPIFSGDDVRAARGLATKQGLLTVAVDVSPAALA